VDTTVFSTDVTDLPAATPPEVLELADGDELHLRPGPVAKRLGDATVRMLGYNGSIPGPTLKVRQGSEIVVHVTNGTDLDTTVHWHGLRLENRFDGVPHETQAPIPRVGSSPTASSSPTRACTGTTRTSARTSPRSWASTAASWPPRPSRTTGRRRTAMSC
jgi:FtsP/CotA-like multicopper oxidase with cupredoxin domain